MGSSGVAMVMLLMLTIVVSWLTTDVIAVVSEGK